ncbi:hypothetical protein BDZ94DRAFT_394202 [Collybia nuda]|uniref:DUF6534 domain-containing protein n=1 Tax=Collybia nuda TaxID=64659 RepID=A0A9P5Y867_9AGAR|nr:hypothetical protein BDZ94DRAFT_394202 [Collybia nuda]
MSSAIGGLSFDSTLGAASIGFSVSCVVFGVLSTQAFTYFQKYPSDRPAYKVLVATLWSLELLDQIFIGYSVYFYTITNYGNPLALITSSIVWTLIVQVMLGACVGTIVKACFTMRVWRFSDRNIFVTGFICLLIATQFGLAIVYTAQAFQLSSLKDVHKLKFIATLALGAGVLTDFCIAIALCYFLRKLRTGYRGSDSLVNSLTIYAINTGALTSAISLCTVLLVNTHSDAFYFMASYFVLGKLYAISFLCALNTRKIIRGRGTDHAATSSKTENPGTSFFIVNHNSRLHNPPTHHTKVS